MTAINNKPSLAAIGPQSLFTQLTGNVHDTNKLHQASYDVLLLRESFYAYARNHWVSDFESFVRYNSNTINVSSIRQSINKTRRRREKKPNKFGLAYLNGLQ